MDFNWTSLSYGLGLAMLDVIAFPIVKYVSLGLNAYWMILPCILYASGPLILLKSLQFETLAIMNLLWDTSSSIIITMLALFLFKEKIPPIKMVGIVLSIVSIALMSYEPTSKN